MTMNRMKIDHANEMMMDEDKEMTIDDENKWRRRKNSRYINHASGPHSPN